MNINDMHTLRINKNRGWRGLAEAGLFTEDNTLLLKNIFSFSQQMWNDLIIHHKLVMQDENCYYVLYFKVNTTLPSPDQQRSVLIKNFDGIIDAVCKFDKNDWRSADTSAWNAIVHFLKNTNNHTTSDWNCIGIRVRPTI